MGNRPHSPELIVTHVPIIAHNLVITHTLVVACVCSWALAVIHEPWWLFWLVVVCALCGPW